MLLPILKLLSMNLVYGLSIRNTNFQQMIVPISCWQIVIIELSVLKSNQPFLALIWSACYRQSNINTCLNALHNANVVIVAAYWSHTKLAIGLRLFVNSTGLNNLKSPVMW